MAAPPYYRFFVGDYLRDAGHLSLLEHGAYRRLIDLYMIEGGPLPFDMPRLYRLLHATSKEEQAAVQVVVDEFFRMDGPVLRHRRCDRELSWQAKLKENQSDRAKIRWENERKTNEIHADALPRQSHGNAIQNQIHNQEELLASHSVDISPSVTQNAPSCPVDQIVALWNQIVAQAGGKRVLNVSPKRRTMIACRWREVRPDTTDEGLRWFENLFRDRIAPSKFATGRQPGRDGGIFRIGIDSALASEQVVDQILEGKYA